MSNETNKAVEELTQNAEVKEKQLYEGRKKFFEEFQTSIDNIIENPIDTGDEIIITNTQKNYGKIIALDGPWGSGKTFFINKLCDELEAKDYRVIKINALAMQKYKDPMYAFLVDESNISLDLRMSLMFNLGPISIEGSTTLSKQKKEYANLLKKYESIRTSTQGEKVVYVIDELDRCNPKYAMDFLEILQHVVSMNCAIVSVNFKVLEKSFSTIFGEHDENYYDKIFYKIEQLPYSLNIFMEKMYDFDIVSKGAYSLYLEALYHCLNTIAKINSRLVLKCINDGTINKYRGLCDEISVGTLFKTDLNNNKSVVLKSLAYITAHKIIGRDISADEALEIKKIKELELLNESNSLIHEAFRFCLGLEEVNNF